MAQGRVAVFDSHLHITDPRFPLVANQGCVPEPFTVDDYRDHTAGLNITGGAVVAGSFQGGSDPSVPAQSSNCANTEGPDPPWSWLLDALGRLGPGFVGVVELAGGATDEEIVALDAAGVRAVRFNLQRGGSLDDDLAQRVHELAGWRTEVYAGGA